MVLECPLPMIVDADALNAMAGCSANFVKSKGPRILTPHPGEMARLTGIGIGPRPMHADERKMITLRYAREWQCIIVLKGHRTVVAAPDGKVYTNTTGNAGLAKAGSGDVLTGMIVALLAQRLKPFQAAKTAVQWHGLTAEKLAHRRELFSFTPTDLIDEIGKKC